MKFLDLSNMPGISKGMQFYPDDARYLFRDQID